ncbi:MAG: DUF3987 domain-containing protein [Pseudonocardiaceae bacterium]|nr:DUF3987 domain-containing protein [Pseudonocardiaceae bacterium]
MTAKSPHPQALDHETALLGLLLHRPASVLRLPLRREHFQQPLHGVIHDAIVVAAEQHGADAGVLYIAETLRARTDVPNLMGRLRNGVLLTDYMASAQVCGGTPEWLAEQIIEAWRRRHVHALGSRLQQLADTDTDLDGVVDQAMSSFVDSLEELPPAGRWEPPTPLAPRRALPRFPVDALPGWLAQHVEAVATFTQTPPDLAGCVALAALSAAAGGRARVQVRPGWVEPVNLFTVVAMPPGSRKSAVFAAMTAPLFAAEAQLVEQSRPLIIDAQLAQRTAHRDAERHATGAADTANPEARAEALGMAADAALAAEQVTVPATPRLVADDITAEAAGSLLAEQGGRLAVLSAEGGIFTTLAGRYSAGVPNLEVFLKGHAGDLLRVDRKGRAAEHVAHPALTLGLAVQPEVLRDIARMPGFRGRGLLARILYAVPANTVGHRRIGAPAIPADVAATYDTELRALALTLADHDPAAPLVLSEEADQLMLALEAELEPRLADGAELGHLADWASKLNGAIARLAGLLHLAGGLRTGYTGPIPAATVEDAARIGHYYLAHALAVFDLMDNDPTVEGARIILDWIIRTRRDRFTRRELLASLPRTRFAKGADLDPPLQLLEEHGYLRRAPAPPATGRRGRPTVPPYDVNPHVLAAETAETAEASPT